MSAIYIYGPISIHLIELNRSDQSSVVLIVSINCRPCTTAFVHFAWYNYSTAKPVSRREYIYVSTLMIWRLHRDISWLKSYSFVATLKTNCNRMQLSSGDAILLIIFCLEFSMFQASRKIPSQWVISYVKCIDKLPKAEYDYMTKISLCSVVIKLGWYPSTNVCSQSWWIFGNTHVGLPPSTLNTAAPTVWLNQLYKPSL